MVDHLKDEGVAISVTDVYSSRYLILFEYPRSHTHGDAINYFPPLPPVMKEFNQLIAFLCLHAHH